jgi:hypothetical protein
MQPPRTKSSSREVAYDPAEFGVITPLKRKLSFTDNPYFSNRGRESSNFVSVNKQKAFKKIPEKCASISSIKKSID